MKFAVTIRTVTSVYPFQSFLSSYDQQQILHSMLLLLKLVFVFTLSQSFYFLILTF